MEGENLEVKCRLTEADMPEYVKDVKFTRKGMSFGCNVTEMLTHKGVNPLST